MWTLANNFQVYMWFTRCLLLVYYCNIVGLHKHAIGAVIGGLIGNYIYRSVQQYNRSQQLLYEDYIRLHPEEFALVGKDITILI